MGIILIAIVLEVVLWLVARALRASRHPWEAVLCGTLYEVLDEVRLVVAGGSRQPRPWGEVFATHVA